MIRKLRRKFLGIAMLSLLGTLTFLVAAIAVGNAILSANRADRAIALLYENGGAFPLPDSAPNPALGFDFQVREETPFETRYFIARLSENQEVLSVDTEHIAALDRQTVIESLNAVLRSGAEKGYVDHYYRFGVFADEGGGSTVIVLDCFLQVQASLNMLRVTLLVSLAGALIVFVILLFSSRVAIRPFVGRTWSASAASSRTPRTSSRRPWPSSRRTWACSRTARRRAPGSRAQTRRSRA